MKIIMRVLEGPNPGQEYHFPKEDESEEEATNILVGRDDVDCQAHWRLGKEDLTVSRAHFILEVRPPNCYLQDNMSTNGLLLLREREPPRRIQHEALQNGDRVRIGRDTVLGFEIILPPPPAQKTEVWTLEEPAKAEVKPEKAPSEPPPKAEVKPEKAPSEPPPKAEVKPEKAPSEPPPKAEVKPEKAPSEPPPKAEVKPEKAPSEPPPKAEVKPEKPPVESPLSPPVQVAPPELEKPQEVEWLCIRCGATLTALPDLSKGSVHATDFMCSNCQKAVDEERQRKEQARAADRYRCSQCGKDVTEMAKSDGHAAELREVALYWCEACARRVLQPRSIGEWRTIKKLGAGGMGEVYQAWHPATGRIAAIKMMLREVKGEERLRLRFLREISIMQDLIHPNIVRLYEAGTHKGNPLFVSEFVPGGDFSQFISKDGKPLLPPQEMATLFAESLVGLHYCHQKGFVHRDLKPENILLDNRDGRRIPKIADFGFARLYEKHGGTISRTGEFAGTWMYMPPEQITDFKRVRPPTDIYAIGVTLYYLLSGQSPLPDFPPPWEIMSGRIARLSRTPAQMVLKDPRVPLEKRNPALPRRLCQVVNKAIAMKPEDRFQTAEEFRRALLEAI